MKEKPFAVKIGEYDFRIHPFNAFNGASVFLFVTKKIVPLLKAFDIDVEKILDMETSDLLKVVGDLAGPALENISDEELQKFMAKCLLQVEILMPAGYVWLYRGDTFAVSEIEYSTKTCLVLCIRALKPLLTDFFGDVDWASLLKPSETTNQ